MMCGYQSVNKIYGCIKLICISHLTPTYLKYILCCTNYCFYKKNNNK